MTVPPPVTDRPTAPVPADPAERLAPGGTSLRPRYRRALTAGAVAVVSLALYHCAMVFLAIAPPSTVKNHAYRQVDWWIYPWFEQGWKMFAPEPVATNRAVEVRVYGADGASRWENLTAMDDARIRGDVMTSRQHANVVRRAWDGLSGLDLRKGPRNAHERIKFRYTRNVMTGRMEQLGYHDFDRLQVRVRMQKVPPFDDMNAVQPVRTVVLPWWKVRT
ncbi:hypothetical protein SRB5_29210 [Streptomyces sp. RB5]|uniref:Uncharacterized protein n=1 Tax=Streptomyces smaragdinus TaxID=2585196 RepID=A0A7K0CIE8_9ACTN|nr:DUF5819 family protein [Streptomyces smaragdinus]MQY12782.1 hypothetical protein [Streptomyces smaragdinus]